MLIYQRVTLRGVLGGSSHLGSVGIVWVTPANYLGTAPTYPTERTEITI